VKDFTKAFFPKIPIGDVAMVVNGGTPKSKVAEYWGGDVQWLTPKDMGRMESREISKTPRTITQAGLKGSSARLVPAGSVILSTRAPIGHLAINTVPMAFNQGCRAIITSDKLDPVYLYYFLYMSRDLLNDLGSGTTFKELSATNLKSVKIPFPPLEEQKRIVAVLDAAFEGLARARAHVEANLQNAQELFESYIENHIANLEQHALVPLEELSEVVSGYSFSSGDFDSDNPIQSIKITNVGLKQFVETDTAKLPIEYLSEFSRFSIPHGSIVIALTRTIISGGLKVAIVPESFSGALLNQRVAALKVSNNDTLRDFLYLFLGSSFVVKYVQEKANTLMQPNLSINDLKKLPVPKVCDDQQKKLVESATNLRKRVFDLIEQYQSTMQDLDDLRQSLLQKAFAGELT